MKAGQVQWLKPPRRQKGGHGASVHTSRHNMVVELSQATGDVLRAEYQAEATAGAEARCEVAHLQQHTSELEAACSQLKVGAVAARTHRHQQRQARLEERDCLQATHAPRMARWLAGADMFVMLAILPHLDHCRRSRGTRICGWRPSLQRTPPLSRRQRSCSWSCAAAERALHSSWHLRRCLKLCTLHICLLQLSLLA